MVPAGDAPSGPQAGALCPRLPGVPEEFLPRPSQPHPQQAPHPAGGQTQRTRQGEQLWEGPIFMAILPPQAVGGIKEPRGAVSAERLEGGTQGIPPPWPGPLSSSASSPTAQVTGSSGLGGVAPVGPRALFFTPGVQAVLRDPAPPSPCLSFLSAGSWAQSGLTQEASVSLLWVSRSPSPALGAATTLDSMARAGPNTAQVLPPEPWCWEVLCPQASQPSSRAPVLAPPPH